MPDAPNSVGEFTTDRALVVRSWNAWLTAATGVPADVACGTPLETLVPELASRGLLTPLRRVLEQGTVEVLAPAFHGYLVPCPPARPSAHFARMQQRVTLAPLRSGESVVGIVARIEDVTERREEERRLAQRLKSSDERERLQAAEMLAAAAAPAAALTDAFSDSSWQVRRAAAAGASADASDEAADLLVRLVRERHQDLGVLNAALTAIAESGAEVLPRLLPLLADPDEDLRIYVALALGLLGDPAATRPLMAALEDPSANVRFHVIEALGRLAARPAAEPLAAVAETRDFFLASAAVEALGRIGDASVSPRLVPLLEDDFLQPTALEALGRSGAEDVVAPLVALMADHGVEVEPVAAALDALCSRFDDEGPGGEVIAALAAATAAETARTRILQALRGAPPTGAAGLVRVAGWMNAEQDAGFLIGALEDPTTRTAAVEGLVRRGAEAAAELIPRLGSLEAEALGGAIVALGRIGSPRAVPALLSVAADSDPDAALLAVAALGGIGDPAAFNGLVELLDTPNLALRQAVIGALSSIGHPEMPARLIAMLRSPAPRLREAAVRIAAYFGYAECLEAVLEVAAGPDAGVRRAAAEHVGAFDDPRVPALVAALAGDAEPTVRAAAMRGLSLLGGAEAVRIAAAAVEDPDPWVRYYAVGAAGALGAADLLDALQRRAQDDAVPPVRIAAMGALAQLPGAGAVPLLERLSEEPDPELAGAALRALARKPVGGEERLVEALRGGDGARQRAVLEGLGERPLSPPLAREVVAAAHRTRDPQVLRGAATALLGGASEGVRTVCRLAADPRRRAAYLSVLTAAASEHLGQLQAALEDPDEAVRDAALEVLVRSAHPAAGTLLARALRDPSADIRRRAAHGLARVDLRAALAGAGADTPVRAPSGEAAGR